MACFARQVEERVKDGASGGRAEVDVWFDGGTLFGCVDGEGEFVGHILIVIYSDSDCDECSLEISGR